MTELLQDELRAQPIDGTFTLAGHAADATPLVGSKSQAQEARLLDEIWDAWDLEYPRPPLDLGALHRALENE